MSNCCCRGRWLAAPEVEVPFDPIDVVETGSWSDARFFTDIGVWFDRNYNA